MQFTPPHIFTTNVPPHLVRPEKSLTHKAGLKAVVPAGAAVSNNKPLRWLNKARTTELISRVFPEGNRTSQLMGIVLDALWFCSNCAG